MIPPRSSSVHLEREDRSNRLADDEESDIELMNSIRSQAHTKKDVSPGLDTSQGEGIPCKLKFAARQLNDRIQLHNSRVSDVFSELLTIP